MWLGQGPERFDAGRVHRNAAVERLMTTYWRVLPGKIVEAAFRLASCHHCSTVRPRPRAACPLCSSLMDPMYRQEVEIFSDQSNAVVMRHPGRNFPGCLIQGDSLYALLQSLAIVQSETERLSEEAAGELEDVVARLPDLMANYRTTLITLL
ncbi:hypothetical protein [Massilia sp. PAMC28688]|uniref:DUF6959 family protein n=1 Tax=Massilia sp. PAMC28688 TaxID=2861283 RepID=UPI0035A5ADF0